MDTNGDEIHLTTREARAGDTPHVARRVLGASLVLIVFVFAIVWLVLGPRHSASGQASSAEMATSAGSPSASSSAS